jgi:hypothetical protein
VQRLATIARGGAACTTHVPLEAPERLDGDRSAPRWSPAHSVRGGPRACESDASTTAPARTGGDDRKAVPHDDRS